MKSKKHVAALRRGVDVFGERGPVDKSLQVRVLGCEFEFVADDSRLLRLVRHAYAGLPQQANSKRRPQFKITLRLAEADRANSPTTLNPVPRTMRLHSGAGLLCGTVDADHFVIVAPQQGTGLVFVSRATLDHSYHVRYEFIEFAVYVLAARTRGLIPLHSACVGRNDRGVLLIGASGAGKSTLALHCLREGMDFVAEDSVMVNPDDLRADGVATFLHLRVGTNYFLDKTPRWITGAPIIRRRSGVRKFEIDLRTTDFRLAAKPLRITSVVFLSARKVRRRSRSSNRLLEPLTSTELRKQLNSTQAYAASQPGWADFAIFRPSTGVW